MKKVLGLCVVVMLSSVSVIAQENKQENRQREGRPRDDAKRMERLAESLKLDEKQMAEFQKIEEAHKQQMQAEHKAMMAVHKQQQEKMKAMLEQKNEEIKKVLTDEQYQQYLEKQKFSKGKQKPLMKKGHPGRDRPHSGNREPRDWGPRG